MLDGVGKCQTSKVIGSLNIHDGLKYNIIHACILEEILICVCIFKV